MEVKKSNFFKKVIASAILVAFIAAVTLFFTKDGSNLDQLRESSGLTQAEYDFLIMMIPHHQQAIEMSELALSRSSNGKIIDLAQKIRGAQDPEITLMKKFLSEAGVKNIPEINHMHGMLTSSEMRELANASGLDFDRLFLKGMIKHHRGAIDMVSLTAGSPLLENLGKEIFELQNDEILLMNQLLQELG